MLSWESQDTPFPIPCSFPDITAKNTSSVLSQCHAVSQYCGGATERGWPLAVGTVLKIFSTDLSPCGKAVESYCALARACLLKNVLNMSCCVVGYQCTALSCAARNVWGLFQGIMLAEVMFSNCYW